MEERERGKNESMKSCISYVGSKFLCIRDFEGETRDIASDTSLLPLRKKSKMRRRNKKMQQNSFVSSHSVQMKSLQSS